MEFSTLYRQIESQIEKNWMLMNSTVLQNQLEQLMEFEKITKEEYESLMQFYAERFKTQH